MSLPLHPGYRTWYCRRRPRSAQFDTVADLAEARIGLWPRLAARHRDHMHVAAGSEPQPLHNRDVETGICLPGARDNLVAWHAVEPQLLGADDAHIAKVGEASE